MDTDTSNISVSAHYTGYIWCRHGLAPKEFETARGRNTYRFLSPASALIRAIIGADMETFLVERHKLLDHLLTAAIEKAGVTQVVEIACGMSPRGVSFSQRYADRGLVYVEADLPGMAASKTQLLTQNGWISERHQVQICNILTPSGPESLGHLLNTLDPTKKTALFTEGLVNYFDLDTLQTFWTNITRETARFPECRYLTEIYPDFRDHPIHRYTRIAQGVIGLVTKNEWPLHYESDAAIEAGFKQAAFQDVIVHNPDDYRELLSLPKLPYSSFVRVVEAR